MCIMVWFSMKFMVMMVCIMWKNRNYFVEGVISVFSVVSMKMVKVVRIIGCCLKWLLIGLYSSCSIVLIVRNFEIDSCIVV